MRALLGPCALLLAACAPSSTGSITPPAVVSPTTALKVAQQELPRVLVANDPNTVDSLFEDPAAAIQKAAMLSNSLQHVAGVTDITVANIRAFAPQQRTYPAQFLATFEATSARLRLTNGVEAAVFVQRAAGAPWKVHSLIPVDADAAFPAIKTDDTGLARMVTDATVLKIKPSALCTRTADLLGLGSSSGDFANDPALAPYKAGTSMAYWLNFLKNRTATLTAGGSTTSDRFTAGDSLLTAYALQGGGALQDCIIEEVFSESAPAGKVYSQLDDRANLGSLVAPGSYRSVTYHAFYRVVIHVPVKAGDSLGFLGVTSFTVSGAPT